MITTLRSALAIAAATAAFAATAQPMHHGADLRDIESRQANQAQRIERGIARGELTRHEARVLRDEQRSIRMAEARAKGRRPGVMDTWIAATAVRHGLVLFTQDAGFDDMPQVQLRRA